MTKKATNRTLKNDHPKSMSAGLRKRLILFTSVFTAVLINFILFIIISVFIGGDAINGKAENGQYFLWGYSAQKGEKGYTEVNKGVYDYSRWHAYGVMVTWPFGMAAAILRERTKRQIREVGQEKM
jgi:hypothetical protein